MTTPSQALEQAIDYANDVAENWHYEEGAKPPDTPALTIKKLRELGYVIAPLETLEVLERASAHFIELYNLAASEGWPIDDLKQDADAVQALDLSVIQKGEG